MVEFPPDYSDDESQEEEEKEIVPPLKGEKSMAFNVGLKSIFRFSPVELLAHGLQSGVHGRHPSAGSRGEQQSRRESSVDAKLERQESV